MAEKLYDLVVIGGGINGTGIAADAAGRGLSVLLAEADDLASATSSASSKLIHGGLRYLEQYEFRLVREALSERETLLAKAPHLIWPLRFVLPHVEGMRPRILLRAGLFLYDHLARRRQLGASRAVDLTRDPAGAALRAEYRHGFSYYDCWVDDARLVVANALAAKMGGAEILTRTPVTGLAAKDGRWALTLGRGASARPLSSRAVVNAAGPWVSAVAGLAAATRNVPPPKLRLVKGSHIVVPRLEEHQDAYIFQNDDGRVVFALPFETQFTLIGTTDVATTGDPRNATASDDEINYLLAVARRFFRRPPQKSDVVWTFAGVRPLDDDGTESVSAVSRDYRFELDTGSGAPILHVIGGKVTTYRRLAEAALTELAPHLPPCRPPWTETAPLPGGDLGPAGFDTWFTDLCARRPRFDRQALLRLARRYGTRVNNLLQDARVVDDLGPHLGGGLSAREVRFLRDEEWAREPADVLWRRTKTGLHVPTNERMALAERVAGVINGG
ncbi:MAG: glycerol-3-phosphate dehydrogenase [Hyphomicrobium sp.]|nr:glycerol-3-phosphate dehydrogenase [Hyphomicrobium sp.]